MKLLPVSVHRMRFGYEIMPTVSRHIIAIGAPVLRASITACPVYAASRAKADGLLYLSIPGIQATDRSG